MNQMALLLLLLLADAPRREFTVPNSPQPEHGHGLTSQESRDGWISLFDGQTGYGWQEFDLESGILSKGKTESSFQSFDLKANVANDGTLFVGEQRIDLVQGENAKTICSLQAAPLRLGEGLGVRSLMIKPLGLNDVFDGKSFAPPNAKDEQPFSGWKILPHPRLPAERQASWQIVDGVIHAKGGPGALQLNGQYANFVLQIEVKTRAELVNGGLFFRSIIDDFMNGYEAQIFNACYEHDPAQPARYSTGAIDDRLLARRLVSRDKIPFVMTVVANADHIGVWVNGYQTVSWTDTRELHENPREGKRLQAGAIQLQAHDPASDLAFSQIRISEFPADD
ncbi:MAG: DUF1080 domain-containing protein [Planctomycetota bacterium]|nr:DUF1080 domain-containing protein [Planctomycetota bacterium]